MAKSRPYDHGDDNPRPTKTQSTVPSTKPELPNYLIFDTILPRLPTKSLMRFGSVCKSWDSFIRDPYFVQLRRSIGNIHGHLISVSATEKTSWDPQVSSAPIHHNNKNSQIAYSTPANFTHILTLPRIFIGLFDVQSVNGFLCFHCRNGYMHYPFTQILNPTTRQHIILPLEDTSSHIPPGAAVAIHFGFDPLRDVFKILRFYKHGSACDFKILTISSDPRWRHIELETPFDPMRCDFIMRERGLYSNGAIHWMDGIDKIVAFDVADEEFKTIWISKKHVAPSIDYYELVEVEGCLSVIGYRTHRFPECLWILKDHKANSWIQHCIRGLPYKIKSGKRMVLPLCEVGNHKIIMLMPYVVHKLVTIRELDMTTESFVSNEFMEYHQPFLFDRHCEGFQRVSAQENFKVLKLRR